jgi:uncharacterized membrane protein YfcA
MPQWLTVLIIGTLVGIVPGLFGVGGGFITVPALHVFAGVPLNFCVGLSSPQPLGPVTTSLLHRREAGTLRWQLALTMFGGTVLGLLFGIEFLEWATKRAGDWHLLGRTIPGTKVILPVANLTLLLSLAALVSWEYRQSRHGADEPTRGWLDDLYLPPYVRLSELDNRPTSLTLLSLIALFVGFLNGGIGMGGAIVMVPSLVYLVGVPTHGAVNATLAVSWLNSIVGTVRHSWLGNVDLALLCLLLVGGGVGARIGSVINQRLSGRRLRGYFSLLIVSAAGLVIYELASLFR